MKDLRLGTPSWGRLSLGAAALMCALVVPAFAQAPKRPGKAGDKVAETPKPEKPEPKKPADVKDPAEKAAPVVKKANGEKEQNFVIGGMSLQGKNRSPQLLYFLERANEELERASLEKRSFIPHLVRSMEEEAL
jgi:hypothetical protein